MLLDRWFRSRREAQIFKLIDQAFEAFGRNDMEAAAKGADALLALEDEQVDALYLKGLIEQSAEHLDQARDFYERAILSKPDFIDPYLKLIVIMRTSFQNDDAMRVCELALQRVKPTIANLVELCAPMVIDFAPAMRKILEPALEREDANARVWALYQHVLHRLRVTGAEYELFMERMRARFPGTPELAAVEASDRGYRKQHDEVDKVLKEYGAKFPDQVFFPYELALAYNRTGRIDQAEAQAGDLLERFPENADFAFLLADIKLAKGQIAAGLKLNERRFYRDLGFSWKYLPMPRWQGEPVAGKKIVVIEEQGFGDSIMFGRYIPELLRRGARIRYVCREQIYSLFAAQPAFRKAEILSLKDGARQPPDSDYYVLAMSIAPYLGIDAHNAGMGAEYLRADEERVAEWKSRLARDGRPLVGVVWAANLTTSFGAAKSIPESLVAQILDNPDVAFVSLQMPAEFNDPYRHLLAHVPPIADFNDTAALIQCMDAVVSVDTSVAHLSASLGQRTIVLSKFSPDWRWAGAEEGPYWYPRATVLRQSALDDWAAPIRDLRPLLADLKNSVATGAAPKQP
jgi:ADP-heptose:LPS heptosyltransferase